MTPLSFPVFCLLYKVHPMETDSSLVFIHIYKMAAQPTAVSSKSSLPQSHFLSISMRELKLALRMWLTYLEIGLPEASFQPGMTGGTTDLLPPAPHTEFPHQSLDYFFGLVFTLS